MKPHNNDLDIRTDVVVVGSGASGATLAHEVASSGLSVVVVEKGDWLARDALAEDELLWKTRLAYQPEDERFPTWFARTNKDSFRRTNVGSPYYLVGGGTVIYAAASWRFREADFRKKTRFGSIDGATLADWPIKYQDLEPYYTRAERELGVSGLSGEDPTEPFRSHDFLDPPIALDRFSKKLREAGKKLGLNSFHIPLAIKSTDDPKSGSMGCQTSGWCSGYPCQFGAKSSADLRIFPQAIATGRCQILTKTAAIRIETTPEGLCSGIVCHDMQTNRQFFIGAKVVVLAASAIQTARLLLFSTSRFFPNGLANSSGMVGKNLMFHLTQKQRALFPEEFPFRLNKLIGFNDYYDPDFHKDPWVNFCSIHAGSRWGPLKFAQQSHGWGTSFIESIADTYPHTMMLQIMIEDLPQESNRVVLHETDIDAFGVPRAKVIHQYHQSDRAAATVTLTRARQILEASGAVRLWDEDIPHDVTDDYTYHIMGTCRFGHTDRDSVLNKFCQAHSVKNLFVIDGSWLPTCGGLNPTLTYQANGYRVGEYIVREAQKLGLGG
ncbi:MAG: GMC family oxidoreductase [Candidatus Riflebacteria bacterium]|nr:GMC family oxidoreductase [Candidatus Riflebacteria bacterium]